MRIVLLILAFIWIVPLVGVVVMALIAGMSRRARSFLRRTLVTG
ncbi:hypothetical protein [Sphingomonas montana]|nr:hypothetical protein [Sphingomonas montana]